METREIIDWKILYDEYLSHRPITVIARRAHFADEAIFSNMSKDCFTHAGFAMTK